MNKNTGITLVDVRQEAMETIKLLREGKIDVKQASTIKDLCNTIIDVAKVQVEFIKAIPPQVKAEINKTEVKAMAGTLVDRDAELDIFLKQIEDSNKSIVKED